MNTRRCDGLSDHKFGCLRCYRAFAILVRIELQAIAYGHRSEGSKVRMVAGYLLSELDGLNYRLPAE